MSDELCMAFPACYRIKVRGAVSDVWLECFDSIAVEIEDQLGKRPQTTLTDTVVNQAALQSILSLLHDMQLPLISLERLPDGT